MLCRSCFFFEGARALRFGQHFIWLKTFTLCVHFIDKIKFSRILISFSAISTNRGRNLSWLFFRNLGLKGKLTGTQKEHGLYLQAELLWYCLSLFLVRDCWNITSSKGGWWGRVKIDDDCYWEVGRFLTDAEYELTEIFTENVESN